MDPLNTDVLGMAHMDRIRRAIWLPLVAMLAAATLGLDEQPAATGRASDIAGSPAQLLPSRPPDQFLLAEPPPGADEGGEGEEAGPAKIPPWRKLSADEINRIRYCELRAMRTVEDNAMPDSVT